MRYTDKGYKVPEADDTDFWDQIVYNIERLDNHTHDGDDSQKVATGGVTPYKVSILTANWVSDSGTYYYDITFPLSWDITWADNDPCPVQIVVRDASERLVLLDSERNASTGVRLRTSVPSNYTVGLY